MYMKSTESTWSVVHEPSEPMQWRTC